MQHPAHDLPRTCTGEGRRKSMGRSSEEGPDLPVVTNGYTL
jgi:hypothetical protein